MLSPPPKQLGARWWRKTVAEPIRATFRKPFTEQVAAFRLRLGNLVPTSAWDDLQHSAHDRGFMVAGAMKADLLADLGAAVDRAIAEGAGIEAFRADFRDIVTRHGWHGWTGEGTAKGEAWRTKVIYRTNMATSMAAGRWAQLVDGKFKYLIYQHSGAAHPRLDHLSWDKLVLPFDHEFWQTHYPPNGWGCGCKVRGAHTLAGARRIGGDPDKPLPDNWNNIDPKSGTPAGVGKGWDYPPGHSVAHTINTMAEKTVNWPYSIARAFMDDLPPGVQDPFSDGYRDLASLSTTLRSFVKKTADGRSSRDPFLTLGRLNSQHRQSLKSIYGDDLVNYQFTVDQSAIKHILQKHGNLRTEAARGQLAVEIDDFTILPRIVNAPDSIEDAGVTSVGRSAVKFSKRIGDIVYYAVFEVRGKKRRMVALQSMWKRRFR